MSITSYFGRSFCFNNSDTTQQQAVAESPLKRRNRPPELHNIVKIPLQDETVIDWGDGYFSNKKVKVDRPNSCARNLFDSGDDLFQITPFNFNAGSEDSINVCNDDLFQITPFVTFDPDDFINEFDYEDVKEQAKLILNSLSFQNFSETEKQRIRSIIKQVTLDFCFDREAQCAELGVVYFYIASKELVYSSNFVQCRTNELLEEAQKSVLEHYQSCPDYLRDKIPSGCKAYLLFALTRMVFTADGAFNPGGCIALKKMMSGPLQNMISEEERMQIIRIADKLLVDEEFALMFKDPFPIHKDMQGLISLDLQLRENTDENFIYLRCDLLIALISSISQHDTEINCFTVAAVSNFLVNSPKTMLKMLIEALKTGKMEFGGRMFSLPTLLESSRRDEADFMCSVNPKDISGLVPFSLARNYLNVEDAQLTEQMLLNTYMTLQFGAEAERAKQIYLSLKQNLLQKLLIAMVQFGAINTHSFDFHSNGKSSMKEALICSFMNYMYTHIYTNSAELPCRSHITYLDELRRAFLDDLYFVDYNNWCWTKNNNNVSFNFHKKGLEYNGKDKDYHPLIHERRLCIFRNGDLIPVDSISELKCYLLNVAREFDLDVNLPLENSPYPKVIEYINSNNAEEAIARSIFNLNQKKSPISADIYKNSDSLFIAQNGSEPVYLETWFPLSSEINSLPLVAVNPEGFFAHLCDKLADYAKSSKEFVGSMKWVLIANEEHLYNIYPHVFKEYWSDKTGNINNSMLVENVYNRAEKCEFTSEKKRRILLRVVGKTTLENHFEHFLSGNENPKQFSAGVKGLLGNELHAALDCAINAVMYEIPASELEMDLETILSDLMPGSFDVCGTRLLKRIEEIKKQHPYFSPYALSLMIYNELVSTNKTMEISRDFIEKYIRKWASLPEVIDIGNMNWTSSLSEKPTYDYLSIVFDFTKGLSLSYRRDGVERPVETDFAKMIVTGSVLYLPKST